MKPLAAYSYITDEKQINVGQTVVVLTCKTEKRNAGEVVHIFPAHTEPDPVMIKKYYGEDALASSYKKSKFRRFVIDVSYGPKERHHKVIVIENHICVISPPHLVLVCQIDGSLYEVII